MYLLISQIFTLYVFYNDILTKIGGEKAKNQEESSVDIDQILDGDSIAKESQHSYFSTVTDLDTNRIKFKCNWVKNNYEECGKIFP